MLADRTGEGRPTIARRLLSVVPYVLTLGIVIFTAQWILEKFLP